MLTRETRRGEIFLMIGGDSSSYQQSFPHLWITRPNPNNFHIYAAPARPPTGSSPGNSESADSHLSTTVTIRRHVSDRRKNSAAPAARAGRALRAGQYSGCTHRRDHHAGLLPAPDIEGQGDAGGSRTGTRSSRRRIRFAPLAAANRLPLRGGFQRTGWRARLTNPRLC